MDRELTIKELRAEGSKYLFEATQYAKPIIERGKGTVVWDIEGKEYLDLNAGQFCLIFGHGYTPFIEMVGEQLEKLYHLNTATLSPEVFVAARKMAMINESTLKKTLFLSTGAEANEAAIRYAKFATGRKGIVSLDCGYHGLTLGTQSSTMAGKWAMPQVDYTFAVKTPDYIHSKMQLTEDEFIDACIYDVENLFKIEGENIAAMILEPIIGVGGMVALPYKYLKAVRSLCDTYGALLIFDECQCGFGRSGSWFVYQKAEIVPDILTTAKAMGMGFAVSAVTFSEKIAQKVEGKLIHFSSHQNDPISASITTFVIDEIEKNNVLDSNVEKGKYLKEVLSEVCSDVELFINPRNVGLMSAFDIDETKIENYKKYSSLFVKNMENNGVLIQAIRQGRTFRIMPNYYIKNSEIDKFAYALKLSAQQALKDI